MKDPLAAPPVLGAATDTHPSHQSGALRQAVRSSPSTPARYAWQARHRAHQTTSACRESAHACETPRTIFSISFAQTEVRTFAASHPPAETAHQAPPAQPPKSRFLCCWNACAASPQDTDATVDEPCLVALHQECSDTIMSALGSVRSEKTLQPAESGAHDAHASLASSANAFYNSAGGAYAASQSLAPSEAAGTLHRRPTHPVPSLPRLRVLHASRTHSSGHGGPDHRSSASRSDSAPDAVDETSKPRQSHDHPSELGIERDGSDGEQDDFPSALAALDESERPAAQATMTRARPTGAVTDHTLGEDVGWPLRQQTVKREAKRQGATRTDRARCAHHLRSTSGPRE